MNVTINVIYKNLHIGIDVYTTLLRTNQDSNSVQFLNVKSTVDCWDVVFNNADQHCISIIVQIRLMSG